ncbi:MAG: hypothetical protein PHF51_00185 [Candidatus ainarchaeum sp.]|nr:hypothetical protein [Candidatus ainarchaeum sp.]
MAEGDFFVRNSLGTVDFRADIDLFRRLFAVSTVLAVLLPRMPGKYLTFERFRQYFSNRIGYQAIYTREAIYLLAMSEVIRIRQEGTMRVITANGEAGMKRLQVRAGWLLGLTPKQVEEWSEGGCASQTRFVFTRVQRWKKALDTGKDPNRTWESEIGELTSEGNWKRIGDPAGSS